MKSDLLKIFQSQYAKENNILISPLCFDIVVNLIVQGTTGATQAELLKFIETSNPELSYNKLIATLEKIKSLEPISQFEQTNTFYFEDKIITPQDSFTQKIRENLSLKFAPIPEEHKGIFQFIIESALNVKAKWKQKFEEVSHKTEFFTLANGEEIETLFITQDNTSFHNETKYLQKDNFQAIQIPMEDEQLVVEIYLPDQKDGLSDLVEDLTVEQLLNWKNEFEEVANMEVILPKFNKEIKYDLTEDFEAIGFKEIFEWSWDFNPMFKASNMAKIKKITQANFFKLNEIGIEAGSITRFYGGIRGALSPKKHIFFEAKHPFLYLLRDLKSSTILFMGTFDSPKIDQDFSIIRKNQEELKNYSENYKKLSFRLGFLFAANAIQRIVEKHKYENKFFNWYIKCIYQLINTRKGEKLDQLFSQLNLSKWELTNDNFQSSLKIPDQIILEYNKVKNILPSSVKSIFNTIDYLEKNYKRIPYYFADSYPQLIQISNRVLDDESLRIPDYNLFAKYTRSDNDLWGDPIHHQEVKIYYTTLNEKLITTNTQKELQQKFSSIRRLKPSLWNISIRGAIYLKMLLLDKIYKKKIESPLVKEMLQDIKRILTTDDEKIMKKLKKLNVWDEQIGLFDPSPYLNTKEESISFCKKFPLISSAVLSTVFILIDYDYSLEGEVSTLNGFYHATVSTLEGMVKMNIPLPDQTFFEKYAIKDGNRFGDPIPVDLKIFEEL